MVALMEAGNVICRRWREFDARLRARNRRLYVAVPHGGPAQRGCTYEAGAAVAADGARRARRIGTRQLTVLLRHRAALLRGPSSICNGIVI